MDDLLRQRPRGVMSSTFLPIGSGGDHEGLRSIDDRTTPRVISHKIGERVNTRRQRLIAVDCALNAGEYGLRRGSR